MKKPRFTNKSLDLFPHSCRCQPVYGLHTLREADTISCQTRWRILYTARAAVTFMWRASCFVIYWLMSPISNFLGQTRLAWERPAWRASTISVAFFQVCSKTCNEWMLGCPWTWIRRIAIFRSPTVVVIRFVVGISWGPLFGCYCC